ncbi:MAG: ABC transporter ATP-binding protein [Patescibacteria group bacterium]
MALLKIENVSRVFGEGDSETVALRDVSLSIEPGEFVAVMGPSGSGKSTLLHILGLLDRPTRGRYIFEDVHTGDLSDQEQARLRNRSIGFVFQAFHLLSRTTVLENVILPLTYSSLSPGEYESRARRALEQVNMTHRLTHVPSQLSGGERQRVAIARALVMEPKVVFADEPTGNLDTASGRNVMELIDALHKKGHTVVLITHEKTAASYAERTITMQDGKILSDEKVQKEHVHYEK